MRNPDKRVPGANYARSQVKKMFFKKLIKSMFDPTGKTLNDMLNPSKRVPGANSERFRVKTCVFENYNKSGFFTNVPNQLLATAQP